MKKKHITVLHVLECKSKGFSFLFSQELAHSTALHGLLLNGFSNHYQLNALSWSISKQQNNRSDTDLDKEIYKHEICTK